MHYVGLDISLNSPGVVVVYPDGGIKCYFWQQRVREKNFHYKEGRVEIIMFPYNKRVSRIQKGVQIGRGMREILKDLPRDDTKLAIEFYSLQSDTSCLTQLAEVAGVVRFVVGDMGFADPIDVAPTILKKMYSGNGSSGKSGMYAKWIAEDLPDLVDIFGVKRPDQKPVEDIVDAYGLAVRHEAIVVHLERLAKRKEANMAKKRKLPEIL